MFALIRKVQALMFIPFDNDPYPLGQQGGYKGSNFPKSSYPPDGGIDSHPFAGFGAPTTEQKSWGCGTKHEDPGCG